MSFPLCNLSVFQMEFLDEESRPRFLLQSRVSPSSISESETLKLNKHLIFICASVSILLLALSFFLQSETLQILLIWIALSLLVGPFAPISITGGDIHVGKGELLEFSDLEEPLEVDEFKKRTPNRRQRNRRSEDPGLNSQLPVIETVNYSEKSEKKKSGNSLSNGKGLVVVEEEKEWTVEDFELLKKQILKHPVGEPRRWELITESFRGRHGLESVIKTAKSSTEKKLGDGDSFSQFLKMRKPLDKRLEADNEESDVGLTDNIESKKEIVSSNWSSAEDIALLNALKAFPKDVSMRWEKIAAAVPGKSKACCMKRVAELKKGFRSSKAS